MALIVILGVANEYLPSTMPSFDPFSKNPSLPLSSWICPLKFTIVSYRTNEKESWFQNNRFSYTTVVS